MRNNYGPRLERIQYICDDCGMKILITKKALMDKKKKQGNLFCSRKCYCKYRSDNYIGENHPRYGKKHSEETKKKIKDASPIRLGKDSPNWKGGITTENNLLRWCQKNKDLRELVFSRDDYTCQICGARNGNGKAIFLNSHHIKSWAKYPQLRFKASNCTTLCVPCHKKVHKGEISFNNENSWATSDADVRNMEGCE